MTIYLLRTENFTDAYIAEKLGLRIPVLFTMLLKNGPNILRRSS